MNQDDKVWGVCRRIKGDCVKCGPEVNTKYGPGMPACYAHADEICQFVEAPRAEVAPTPEAKEAARYIMDNARDFGERETILANEVLRLSDMNNGEGKK